MLGGAVQDFVILFCSLRRDGPVALGQMMKDELNSTAGFVALLAILCILVILLAVLALVVVNTLAESPWGVFTVGATIPIALFMGVYLRGWRVGKVLEASAIGVVLLLLLGVWGGQWVYPASGLGGGVFVQCGTAGLDADRLWIRIERFADLAAFGPSADYLSAFIRKLGTIFSFWCSESSFCCRISKCHRSRRSPATGHGPVFAGKLFPFCFITIACGAVSGFHSLISSGTTPKIITFSAKATLVAGRRLRRDVPWSRWWPSWP